MLSNYCARRCQALPAVLKQVLPKILCSSVYKQSLSVCFLFKYHLVFGIQHLKSSSVCCLSYVFLFNMGLKSNIYLLITLAIVGCIDNNIVLCLAAGGVAVDEIVGVESGTVTI